jgi:hypothetical protein
VREGLDAELVYGLTRALWSTPTRGLLDAGHAKGRLIRPETATLGIGIPLHPGAERFYAEWRAARDKAAADGKPGEAGTAPDAPAGSPPEAAPLDDLGSEPAATPAAPAMPDAPVPEAKPGTPAS